MAQVKKINQCSRSLGMKSLINFINSHDKAKTVEISKNAKPFKIDVHDSNFDEPIENLTKIYH